MNLAAILDEHCAAAQVPGASAAVLHRGVLTEAAYGVLNLGTGVATTTDSLFQIGSITKVWTTVLLLQLVERGLLELDDPIGTYLPELPFEKIPVRRLLNHTSGLPGDWFPDTGRGDDCLERYLPLVAEQPLTPPTGRILSYSNSAFILVGLIIERVTGMTWDRALREQIIEPLGLTSTVTLPEEALLHRAAVGHLGLSADQKPAPVWGPPRNCGPAGLIASTAGDVARFAREHTAVLSAELRDLMTTPKVDVTGPGMTRMGLGWFLDSWSGTPVWQHDGGTIGQVSALRMLPEHDLVIVLLTNGGRWAKVRDGVLGDVANSLARVSLPPVLVTPTSPVALPLEDYVGTFRNHGTETVVEVVEGVLQVTARELDELEALVTGPPTGLAAVPYADDVFLVSPGQDAPPMPITFVRDDDGAVVYLCVGSRTSVRVGGKEP